MNGVERMVDHWWWRPGWAVGRRFYTWHLTFAGRSEVYRLAGAYRRALAPLHGLDLVPDEWLHLTMQGLGFVGEIDESDVDAIVSGAAKHLALVAPFDLVLTRPTVTPEAIRWDPDSPGPAAVREALRVAIGEVWPIVPEPSDGFGAHVTIAYSNCVAPVDPARAALDAVDAEPALARVRSADLIVLGRDDHAYTWEPYASVSLGG